MPDADKIAQVFSATIEAVIKALATGVAEAQSELDLHSIATQQRIDEDPILSEAGLQATWYQLPKTELDLTMAVALEEPAASSGTTGGPGPATGLMTKLHLQPVNAQYQNQFSFDARAASTMHLSIVPVPAPIGSGSVTPAQDRSAIEKIATDEIARRGGAAATTTAGAVARVVSNFNPATRLWSVLGYEIAASGTTRKWVVVVDDGTAAIVRVA